MTIDICGQTLVYCITATDVYMTIDICGQTLAYCITATDGEPLCARVLLARPRVSPHLWIVLLAHIV
jgi:hypothetical protein